MYPVSVGRRPMHGTFFMEIKIQKVSIYTTKVNKGLLELEIYGKLIALLGQAASHARHSMQSSGRAITAFPSTISITFTGQTSTQAATPLHVLVSTVGGKFIPLLSVLVSYLYILLFGCGGTCSLGSRVRQAQYNFA